MVAGSDPVLVNLPNRSAGPILKVGHEPFFLRSRGQCIMLLVQRNGHSHMPIRRSDEIDFDRALVRIDAGQKIYGLGQRQMFMNIKAEKRSLDGVEVGAPIISVAAMV